MEKSLNWLEQLITNLPAECQNPPLSEIEEGEEVIGELTDPWLKSLLGATHYLTTKAQKLHKDHLVQHLKSRVTEHDCEKVQKEIRWLLEQTRLIKNLFWISVQHLFNIPYGNFGIREGWKIVSLKEDDDQSEEVPDFLKSLVSLAIVSKMMTGDNLPLDIPSTPPEEQN